MLNALAQAQADKVAAQAEVNKLANSSVKDSLQGRLNNLVDQASLRLTTQTATALRRQRRCRLGRG